MIEDFEAIVMELLVASNIKIHWSIYKYLQSLYKNQVYLTLIHW